VIMGWPAPLAAYMSLDVAVVREAITRDGVRESPACASSRRKCRGCGATEMAGDTRASARAASAEAPSCPAPRFDVPEFMVPKSPADVRELARLIALAEWAPDSYRDLEGNYIQQKIELAIMHGATVGLGPIAAVQSIAVVDGMPTIWGDGALSIVERRGCSKTCRKNTSLIPRRADGDLEHAPAPSADPIVNRFSMAMAEAAHLLQKEGPWQTYPQRILKMRARSWTICRCLARVAHSRRDRRFYPDPRYLADAPQRRPKLGL
jgi:hypothetical protein